MRITVKVGSNVLTRPDGHLDITRMSALVDDVAALRRAGIDVILVSSGAVAAGRSELGGTDTGRLDPVSARQLFSAVGQARLIDRYVMLFGGHGLTCGQVLTTKENFATRHHYLNQQNCMEVMLRAGVVPVVNENDTVSVTELMFTDNDELSGLIAAMMGCERLVLLSNIDGVYTAHPSEPGARLISRIEPGCEPEVSISATRSSRGRGGMGTKYRVARRLAAEGVEVDIANGTRPGILRRLVLGEEPALPYTCFAPAATPVSGVKRWLAHSGSFAKGTVVVNDGAADRLRSPEGAASVLGVGVTAVDGDFGRGEVVRVAGPDGSTLGWGKAECGADEARAKIGRPATRPIIHADYLFIE